MICINYLRRFLYISAAVISAAVLLFDPAPAARAVANAFSLCGSTLIPSLLPFFIINSILIGSGFAQALSAVFAYPFKFLFGISGNSAPAVILGSVSGFPIGAKCVFSLYECGVISKNEAERLLAFCCNAGPAFLVAGAGGLIFGDTAVGWQIYFSQLFAAFAVGILFNLLKPRKITSDDVFIQNSKNGSSSNLSISDAIADSVIPMLTVCVFTLFFAVVFEYLSPFLPSGIAGSVIKGIFELVEGINAAKPFGRLGIALSSAFAAWSGISVMMQTAAIAPKDISLKDFYLGKLLCAPIAFFVSLLLSYLF